MNPSEALHMYKHAFDAYMEVAANAGAIIVSALREVVPDLEYSVGWAEGDTLCFWSHAREDTENQDDQDLGWFLAKRGFPVECPFGVYLSREELARVAEILGVPLDIEEPTPDDR